MGLVIIGAGGHAREVHNIVDRLGLDFAGFAADGLIDHELIRPRGPYLGGLTDLLAGPPGDFVIAIGDGAVRKRLDAELSAVGWRAATLVDPAAIVGRFNVSLGEGTVVCAGAQVTTDCTVGRHVHLNRAVQVGHDCTLADFVTMHPGSVASGGVRMEDGVTVGTGAVVIPRRTVGAWTTVGAGAAVVHDLPPERTAIGVPARVRAT